MEHPHINYYKLYTNYYKSICTEYIHMLIIIFKVKEVKKLLRKKCQNLKEEIGMTNRRLTCQ